MSTYPDEFDKLHKALVADASERPEYQNTAAISGYSEGAEHALDSIRINGYAKPAITLAQAITQLCDEMPDDMPRDKALGYLKALIDLGKLAAKALGDPQKAIEP